MPTSRSTKAPKAPKAPKVPKPAKTIAARTSRRKSAPTLGRNGDSAAPVPALPSSTFLSQLHTSSRVLTAASLSRDRAPLRSVEVPGLGPNASSGVVFYRPHSTADFLRLVESADRVKDAAPIEQIRFLVDHLEGRWCDPSGRPYTRDEILALEPSNLALISNAILYAKEITVDDHEALLAELGIPLDPVDAASVASHTTVLSPNGSGGALSSAASTD